MTSIENAIWRAPTTVLVCSSIIHAEGVPSKEMNKFRLRSFVTGHFHADLARAKFIPKLSDSFDRIDVCAVEDENASSFE